VHAAARMHVMHENPEQSLEKFRTVNVKGTLQLASQAVMAEVKRFIFISSIKVNGEVKPIGRPFTADDTPAPLGAYGISKYEAEQALLKLAENH
jgi:nucleoside-diphosphate-sugar epimerase